MKTVWIYVDTRKTIGDAEYVQVFSSAEAANDWFKEHDPEGVAFEQTVVGS